MNPPAVTKWRGRSTTPVGLADCWRSAPPGGHHEATDHESKTDNQLPVWQGAASPVARSDAARAALDAEGSPKLMGHRRAGHVTHHRAVVIVIVIVIVSASAVSSVSSVPTGHRFALRSPLVAVRSYLRL